MTKDQLEQETQAWLAGLGYTRLPRPVSGQLQLPEVIDTMKVASAC